MTPIWENLLKTSLVGTERQPLNFTTSGDALSATLAQLSTAARETALLKAAGAAALYQRAGALPVTSAPATVACDLNDLPVINERAALHLRRMLQESRYQALLPEWLAAIAQSQRRLPATALPQLLQLGANQADLRDALLPPLGARGRWLAAQHPSGHWVTGAEADDSIWHEGTFEQRCAYLKQLRLRDAEKARTLLQATWEQEPPKERAAFLALLRAGLSRADEALLENALDDKRKEVRTAAAELLAGMSESAFGQRMQERAISLLKFKTKSLGKDKLEVNAPAECTPAMQRDGLEKGGQTITAAHKQAWVEAILSTVPLTWWNKQLKAPPTALINAALHTNWKATLLSGWSRAAIHHPDEEWTRALLPALAQLNEQGQLHRLLEALSASQRARLVSEQFDEKTMLDYDQPLGVILLQTITPLDEALSRRVITALAKRFAEKKIQESYWPSNYFAALALNLAPSMAEAANAALQAQVAAGHNGSPALQNLSDTLQFRYEMLKELH
jgi:hypothetical protein